MKASKEKKLIKGLNDSSANIADILVDEIAKNIFGINIVWAIAKGFYGAAIRLRQEKAIEWIEMVRDNPSIFTEMVFSDEKFQEGFVTAFQQYLTARVKEKRKYLRNIFIDFTRSKTKDEFELERLYDSYLKISPHGINVLMFIKTKIVPFIEEDLKKEVAKSHERPKMREEEITSWKQKSLSHYISKWIHETYNPGKEFANVYENEFDIRRDIFTGIDELVSLGILKINTTQGLGGISLSSGSAFGFSTFGFDFLEYITETNYSFNTV
jgi:hypothetical protein